MFIHTHNPFYPFPHLAFPGWTEFPIPANWRISIKAVWITRWGTAFTTNHLLPGGPDSPNSKGIYETMNLFSILCVTAVLTFLLPGRRK